MSEQQSRWFKIVLRVRYQETDQMGVVYHANYLNWFEIGRTELIREMGLPYKELENRGLLLPVLELESKFHAPAKYDDEVVVWTRIAEFSPLMVRFESQVRAVDESGPASDPASGQVSASVSGPASALVSDPAIVSISKSADDTPSGRKLVTGGTKHIWVDRQWKPVRIHKEAPDLYALIERAYNGRNY